MSADVGVACGFLILDEHHRFAIDGFDVLEELGVDDAIKTVTVVDGANQLKAHA